MSRSFDLTGSGIERRRSRPERREWFAAVSPDDRRLAGLVDPGGAAGSIWMADLARGTAFQKVIDLPADVRMRGAAWVDGDRLIVATTRRTRPVRAARQRKLYPQRA